MLCVVVKVCEGVLTTDEVQWLWGIFHKANKSFVSADNEKRL